MDYSIKKIKEDIVNLSEKEFMMKYLLKSSNWYFSEYQNLEVQQAIEQMEGLKSILNSKIGVAFHNVLMVGSGKIGCSLSPFKNFKSFDENSDIDIAIISLKLFYEIWGKIRLASVNEYIPYYNDIASSVFRGFINEKHFTNVDLARQHWGNATAGLNRSISEEIKIYHPINYRIYRSWEDLEDYHLKGINLLKNKFMGIIYSRSEQKVREVYRDYTNNSLIVDESYQRRSVWADRDKIRLIETILLGLIVPELYFWDAETDANSGQTITHIVDGQQRIKAIVDFIDNKIILQKEHLLDPIAKELYGDKSFSDLDNELKKQLWAFRLSVIRIENKDMDEIRKIFFRVNLTNYSLNDQERRHSNSWGKFADLTSEVISLSIWDDYSLFNAGDIRRRKDEEFCSTLILLAKKGIIDQTTQKPLNDAYTDYAKDYPDYEEDKLRIQEWGKIFVKFYSESIRTFVRKRTQLYTIFCLIDYIERKKIQVTDEIISRFNYFVQLYTEFENSSDSTPFDNDDNVIQQYKLASSEGVNKIRNRKIRFEILRDFVLVDLM